jgi:hypothetical protein
MNVERSIKFIDDEESRLQNEALIAYADMVHEVSQSHDGQSSVVQDRVDRFLDIDELTTHAQWASLTPAQQETILNVYRGNFSL